MDYASTYPKAYTRYYASDMILNKDRYAAYLIAPKVRSRVVGYYHLIGDSSITQYSKLNGAIHVEYKTLRYVVSSTAESEVVSVFHNTQVDIPVRTLLHALKYPQPPAPIKTDDSTAFGCICANIHQRAF